MSNSTISAKNLLKNCIINGGFAAATEEIDNYRYVWSRDGCVNGLASLILDDIELIAAFKSTLQTLANYQGPNGEIPSNVCLGKNRVSYGTTVGRVDASIWFIIGVCVYGRITGDHVFVIDLWKHVERAHNILDAWEFNQRGMVYVPFGGDWADEYILSGYLLYDQVLRLWAMRELNSMAIRIGKNNKRYIGKSNQIEKRLNENYLPTKNRPYFLAGFNPGHIYYQFDAFGNVLCCLLNIGPKEDRLKTLEYAYQHSIFDLVPAFHPVIERDDPQYSMLVSAAKAVGKKEPKNKPGCYHNGGLWPFINGFWVLAAKQLSNQKAVERWTDGISKSNALNDNGFYEYRDARTGDTAGTRGQAWSAAGHILSTADVALFF